MHRFPLVSVVMPVYNAERYLREAIESILAQTFSDFEFLIIDNGSTDGSRDIIHAYVDSRLRVLSESRRGLVPPLNKGLVDALGKYIAKMDADDVSAPERLEKQVDYLQTHQDTVMVGCWAEIIDSDGKFSDHSHILPTDGMQLYAWLCVRNAFIHGTVMMRRDAVLSIGGYRQDFDYAEDYDLWLRLAEIGQVANIGEFLYRWRTYEGSTTRRLKPGDEEKWVARARRNALQRYLRRLSLSTQGALRGRRAAHEIAPQIEAGLDALTLIDWVEPYIGCRALCVGDFLMLRALISNPRDARVWSAMRQRYMSRSTARALRHMTYDALWHVVTNSSLSALFGSDQ